MTQIYEGVLIALQIIQVILVIVQLIYTVRTYRRTFPKRE